MEKARLILVTHKKPDLDAVASLFLWLMAHRIPWDSGEDIYKMKFVNPGQRLEVPPEGENIRIIHFDTGRMHDDYNYDHHQLGSRAISATGLVWQRFFKPGENPAIDEMVAVINHSDNGLRYHTEDLGARNLFAFGFILSGINKFDPRGSDFSHTMITGFSMLDGYLANCEEVQVLNNITNNMPIFQTSLGQTIALDNVPGDSSAIRSYLKKYYNGTRGPLVNTCVVKFSEGSIGVIVCIDPGEEQDLNEDAGNDNYPEAISLFGEMKRIYNELKDLDSSQGSNIYLHYSGFALYINRSQKIALADVLRLIAI